MESLNLNTLVNSLPNGQQNAEKELLNDFKAAALSITTLYRSSRKNSKRAYNNGYSTACQDMLSFIQQGVSASDIGQAPSGTSHAVEGGGMTIGRVMDWIEARVDAIRAREEEEEEDEEREKDKERAPRPAAERPVAGPVAAKSDDRKAAPAASAGPSKAKATPSSLPTPSSPVPGMAAPSAPTSPSPPPLSAAPRHKASKGRPTPTKEPFHPTAQTTHIPPTFISDPFPVSHSQSSIPFAEAPVIINAGSKRRHAMMMMLDSSSSAISIGGPSSAVSSPGGTGTANGGANTSSSLGRRRTRNRNLQPHNSNISVVQMAPEDMDIEEDGRERKRVARR